jgi:hypothetical protein
MDYDQETLTEDEDESQQPLFASAVAGADDDEEDEEEEEEEGEFDDFFAPEDVGEDVWRGGLDALKSVFAHGVQTQLSPGQMKAAFGGPDPLNDRRRSPFASAAAAAAPKRRIALSPA